VIIKKFDLYIRTFQVSVIGAEFVQIKSSRLSDCEHLSVKNVSTEVCPVCLLQLRVQ